MKEDKKDRNNKRKDEINKDENIYNDYRQSQTNENVPDPSAKRNIGLGGETQRHNQKDNLDNLVIRGNEVTGYGANDHKHAGENAQGPGFEAEGSDVKGFPIRRDPEEGFDAEENAK
ncbi:MAG: hypothetical protein LPJ89_07555 [Hymenobacteraceae bacterium]|nr:hypothetical protein [Hymenobacteraceae bacterium]MDX5397690.1 hypothetical protein [Hymenobacteraceae bacterium]MDX5443622.1 hypothetical protein [Hymenobacteraceae bacterium]MDX5513768.1 hypothetical protein [Hymenobacteraceae bacterium]